MTRVLHYALLFMIMATMVDNIYAQSPIVIKFSHVNGDNSPKGVAAKRFKELAEKMTQDKVRVDIYPDGQLYNDNEALEALQLGAIQMLAPSPSKISALGFHEFEVFDLPYLFPNREALYRVTQGPIGRGLLHKLESKGIVGLAFWDNGFKSMFSNKPVHKPKDMHELKMRIDPSLVLATQMHELGAIPVTLSFSDMVRQLKSNAIDGTENTPSNFYSQNYVKVPDYLVLTNHGYLGYAVVTNKKFWDGLPPEVRAQLINAMKETTKYANLMAQQQNESDLAAIKASGKTTVYELNDTEKSLWRKALSSVQKKMHHRIGNEMLTAVNQTIKNPRK